MKRALKKADIALILAVAAAAAAMLFIPRGKGVSALVTVGGETVAEMPLNTDAEFDGGGFTVTVKDGAVYFSHSDCRDKICMNTGRLTKAGDTAVCLPQRAVITVTGGSGTDAVTY